MWDAIERFPDWAEHHPVLFSAFLVPIAGTVFNVLKAPRTAEQYAALPGRFAAFCKIMAALFPNPSKAIEGAKQVVSGNVVPAAVIREAQLRAHAKDLAAVSVDVVDVPFTPSPYDAPTRPELEGRDTPTPTPTTVRERPEPPQ